MLLLIDNFDSFTFNLVHAIEGLGIEVVVIRNNAKSVLECLQLKPTHLLVGPGPGTPRSAGISKELIKKCEGLMPVLGVCLGHQCIAELYGGNVIRSKLGPMHGKTSSIYHNGRGVFSGLTDGFAATRYHSLVAERETLPDSLEITAETEQGEIMGLRHREWVMEGVQFHPESVLTKEGLRLLDNFLNQVI